MTLHEVSFERKVNKHFVNQSINSELENRRHGTKTRAKERWNREKSLEPGLNPGPRSWGGKSLEKLIAKNGQIIARK